jgi:hypothetical protein
VNELREAMVVFILRGVGLTDVAVQQYAHSSILKEIAREIFKPTTGLVFLSDENIAVA